MILVLAIAWAVAYYLFITDPDTDFVRYAALMLFVGGVGALGQVMITTLIPYLAAHHLASTSVRSILHNVYLLLSFITETGLPYSFLMFSICYSNFVAIRTRRTLGYALALPPISMLYTVFSQGVFSWGILYSWVAPYYLVSFSLLIATLIKEDSPSMRRRKLFTVLLTFPQVFIFLAHYTSLAFHIPDAYRLIEIVVPAWLVFMLICTVKQDFLGIKLRAEKMTLNNTMRAVSTGTAILNHSLKNEIGKINILTDRIRSKINESGDDTIAGDIDIIQKSADHLLGIIDRIQHHMQEITIQTSSHRLSDILESALFTLKPYTETLDISLDIVKSLDPYLLCDRVHLQEVFSNLILNAFEATGPHGNVEIHLDSYPKGVTVAIRDNGVGIKKDTIPYLFDPFFSTKLSPNNFGLGLSYSHNVLQRHGASLEIQSEPGSGTTVRLFFPNKLVVEDTDSIAPAEVLNG